MESGIGIVTLYQDNFGSILQCYSSYRFVESLGYECTIITPPRKSLLSKICKAPGYCHKLLTQRNYLRDKKIAKQQLAYDSMLLSTKTRENMEQFITQQFNIYTCSSVHKLKKNCKRLKKVIVGSDQIWNISGGIDEFRFLAFVPGAKKIALAPSFGTTHIPESIETQLKKHLATFSVLSARENSGTRIIETLTGRPATRLPDPTILLSKEQWCDFARAGVQQQNYILVHFLNEPNSIAFAVINRYLTEHNVHCICIVNNYESYDRLTRHEFLDIGPYDYVSLINNADFVFTDSFHSTLFSLNLETNFLTFDRQYSHANSQKTRVIELLDRCHELDRFIEDEDQGICKLKNMRDWTSEALFSQERALIRSYLKEEIER